MYMLTHDRWDTQYSLGALCKYQAQLKVHQTSQFVTIFFLQNPFKVVDHFINFGIFDDQQPSEPDIILNA